MTKTVFVVRWTALGETYSTLTDFATEAEAVKVVEAFKADGFWAWVEPRYSTR